MAKKTTNIEQQYVNIQQETNYRIHQTIKTWRDAILIAEDAKYPRRYELYKTYADVILDNHLSAVIDLFTDKITSTDFEIKNKDTDECDEIVEELFEQKWFFNFLTYYVETIFYGHSLLQITNITENSIKELTLIDRNYVSPEKRLILNRPQQLSGISYDTLVDPNYLIEIENDKNKLGLLYKISPFILYKKNSMQYWSNFSEKFGSPFRIVKTKSQRSEDRQRLMKFLKDAGNSGFGVLNDTDTLEYLATSQTDSYSVFNEFIKLLNNEVSKLVLGGTEGVDGASGGSEARSKVHNGQADIKTLSVLRDITFYVNDILIPKLKNLNLISKTSNVKFEFCNKEQLSLMDRAEVDSKVKDMIGKFDNEYLEKTYGVKINEIEPINNVNDTTNAE